ncbi:MAG: hypothetical protein H7A25_05315 [Leptospiraceae bacterium]|nr:hypothetical protein [Leptospiraceae bacterium]MCP5499299.1 hypothetical protein [Leptospiraceae bacterium]
MALTKQQKLEYNESLKEFKSYIEELKKEVILYKSQMKKNKDAEPYYIIGLVLNSIRFINTCIEINKLSQHKLRLKSEFYLNLGRKEIYSVFTNMEKVVSMNFDGSLAENSEYLEKLDLFSPSQRLNFIHGFRAAIEGIVDAYGDQKPSGPYSKWKWSWPEIYYKLAILSKNLFDFKAYEKERDINNMHYYVRKEHFNLIIELCNYAAQEYRTKFDLSTSETADLRKSVIMLEILKMIYQITGIRDDLDKTKTLIESLNNKIDTIESEKTKKKKLK